MDRRRFLRDTGLLAAGAAAGGVAAARVLADPAADRAAAQSRAYANERWSDAGLAETRVIWHVETDEKVVALTFDDGPMPRNTAGVLDVLEDRKAPATFNVVGERVMDYRGLVEREMRGRHQVENHSWSHADLALATREQAEREVRRGANVVESVTGRRPRFFRPPKGNVSGTALASAARAEADVLLWSLQLHEAAFDAEGNADYVLRNVRPGTILLAHDVGDPSRLVGLRALPLIIDGLRDRGYTLVTVDDLLTTGRAIAPPAPASVPAEG